MNKRKKCVYIYIYTHIYFFSFVHVYTYIYECFISFPGGSAVKNLPAMQETQVRSLGGEDPLEKEMATHSRILAWGIHGQRSLEGYSPSGRREGRDWAASTHASPSGCRRVRYHWQPREQGRQSWGTHSHTLTSSCKGCLASRGGPGTGPVRAPSLPPALHSGSSGFLSSPLGCPDRQIPPLDGGLMKLCSWDQTGKYYSVIPVTCTAHPDALGGSGKGLHHTGKPKVVCHHTRGKELLSRLWGWPHNHSRPWALWKCFHLARDINRNPARSPEIPELHWKASENETVGRLTPCLQMRELTSERLRVLTGTVMQYHFQVSVHF